MARTPATRIRQIAGAGQGARSQWVTYSQARRRKSQRRELTVDSRGKGEVGLQPFGGAPDPAAEGDRVSTTGNPHQAKLLARSGAGPSYPNAGADPQRAAPQPRPPSPQPSSRNAQLAPILPSGQPMLLVRVHDALPPRPHSVGVRPSTIRWPAQHRCASRALTGIAHSTLLKQKGTFGGNVPDDDDSRQNSRNSKADPLSLSRRKRSGRISLSLC